MLIFEDKSLGRIERILLGSPDFASLVPTQLFRLLACDPPPLATRFLIGGAPLSCSLYQQAIRRGLNLSLTYGLTELSSTVLLSQNPVWKGPLPYLGFPLEGQKLSIRDQELFAEGTTLFSGYINSGIETPFPTKDCASYEEQFGFLIQGRKDFQFLSGGETIQPEEIEAVLLSHPKIEQAIVIPFYDEEYGAKPVAWVHTTLCKQDLKNYADRFLPKNKIPALFLSLCSHTLTSHGIKPNRQRLIEDTNKNFTIISSSNLLI